MTTSATVLSTVLLAQTLVPTPGWKVAPTPSPAPIRAPMVVVERLSYDHDTVRRMTLFANRVAVVAVREGSEQVFLRRLTLDEDVYIAYVAALQRDAVRLDGDREREEVTAPPRGVITMSVGGQTQTVEYSPLRIHGLATAGLVATLDDLERVVSATSESHEALQHWQPHRGDVVEMWTGEVARVRDVELGGVVVLVHDRTGIIEIVPPEARGQRIRSVLEESR